MVRRFVSFRLSLAAVFIGLYALGMTSVTGASEVEQHVVAQQADPVVFGANSSAYLRHVSHPQMVRALTRTPASTFLFETTYVAAPDFAQAVLARENVLSLGGVPRAPGPSRAPPTA